METLATKIAQAVTTRIDGTWQRHAPARYAGTALSRSSSLPRWGTENSYTAHQVTWVDLGSQAESNVS